MKTVMKYKYIPIDESMKCITLTRSIETPEGANYYTIGAGEYNMLYGRIFYISGPITLTTDNIDTVLGNPTAKKLLQEHFPGHLNQKTIKERVKRADNEINQELMRASSPEDIAHHRLSLDSGIEIGIK